MPDSLQQNNQTDSVSTLPGLKELWEHTLGHPGIRIAILDGPVDYSHPCFSDASITEAIPGGLVERPKTLNSAHGTHVASIILGQHQGPVRGVVPGCSAVVIPVYGEEANGELIACSQMDLARSISQALQEGANIINISGGELTHSGKADPFIKSVVEQCAASNVLIVAATGNEGCECLHVPAALPTVLAVGAGNADGLPMEFSNWDESLSVHGILAPGERIVGAVPNNGVTPKSGTSFATPIITGVAALLLSLQKLKGDTPNPNAVRQALIDTAIPCSDQEQTECPRMLAGRVNIPGVVKKLFPDLDLSQDRVNNSGIPVNTAIHFLPPDGRVAPKIQDTNVLPPVIDQFKEEISMSNQNLTENPQPIESAQQENQTSPSDTLQGSTDQDVSVTHSPAQTITPTPPQVGIVGTNSGSEPAIAPQGDMQKPVASLGVSEPSRQIGCGCGQSQLSAGASVSPSAASGFNTSPQNTIINSQSAQLIYSVAEIGFDFGSDARSDYFNQQFTDIRTKVTEGYKAQKGSYERSLAEGLILHFDIPFTGSVEKDEKPDPGKVVHGNFEAMAKYLAPPLPTDLKIRNEKQPEKLVAWAAAGEYLFDKKADANAILWTLNIDSVPVYCIRPISQFAIHQFDLLTEFLGDSVDKTKLANHVSVAGYITGSIRLYNGTIVPTIDPVLRGMFNWNNEGFINAVLGSAGPLPKTKQSPKETAEDLRKRVQNFIDRIYYQLRNLGSSPQERAINYFSTNAFQASQVFLDVMKEADRLGNEVVLDTITVEPSPICRPESECYDVVLQFFNPLKREAEARKVYRQTVDVSDVVPVSIGPMRSWHIY